jgi:hypothetical protein
MAKKKVEEPKSRLVGEFIGKTSNGFRLYDRGDKYDLQILSKNKVMLSLSLGLETINALRDTLNKA